METRLLNYQITFKLRDTPLYSFKESSEESSKRESGSRVIEMLIILISSFGNTNLLTSRRSQVSRDSMRLEIKSTTTLFWGYSISLTIEISSWRDFKIFREETDTSSLPMLKICTTYLTSSHQFFIQILELSDAPC